MVGIIAAMVVMVVITAVTIWWMADQSNESDRLSPNGMLRLSGVGVESGSLQIQSPEKVASEIIIRINSERVRQKLTLLNRSPLLDRSARLKLDHLSSHHYWAHTSPDGVEPWSFFNQAGYKYSLAGENLAKQFDNADGVVDGWMKSPMHHDVMLDPRYADIGVAVDTDNSGTTLGSLLVVAHFGLLQ